MHLIRSPFTLTLASNGVLPIQSNGTSAENKAGAVKGKKRANEEEELASAPQSKAARRSLGSTARVEEVEEEKVVQEVKKKGRRSLAVAPKPASPAGRLTLNFNGLFSSVRLVSKVGLMKLPRDRTSKRKSLSGSMSVSSCPSPSPAIKEHLALVEEKEEKDQETIVNPTPMVRIDN